MNKLIKSLAVAVTLAVASTSMADDSYLYWMADISGVSNVSYGRISAYDEEGDFVAYLGVVTDSAGTVDSTRAGKFTPSISGVSFNEMIAFVGSETLLDAYKFQLELLNSNSDIIALSDMVLATKANLNATAAGMSGTPTVFSGFAIPEPTSGMLALLGFGLLALRRKQKNA